MSSMKHRFAAQQKVLREQQVEIREQRRLLGDLLSTRHNRDTPPAELPEAIRTYDFLGNVYH